MKIRAGDLLELGVIDEVVEEAVGGAHSDPGATAELLGEAIARHLEEVEALDPDERLRVRYEKFRRMGRFEERATQ